MRGLVQSKSPKTDQWNFAWEVPVFLQWLEKFLDHSDVQFN